jgi:hypothetical protein
MAVDGGDTAVIWVAESTVKLVASPAFPNFTLVAPVNPVPVITTAVPPAIGPVAGAIEVTTGAAGTV